MKFEVIGKIKGKARPRFGNGRTYTPSNTKNYEKLVLASYLKAKGIKLHNKPIKMKIKAIFEPPKSISKKKRAELLKGGYVTKKPDFDNIEKIVADALNKTAFDDDSQICESSLIKIYGEEEKLVIEIEEAVYEDTKDNNEK